MQAEVKTLLSWYMNVISILAEVLAWPSSWLVGVSFKCRRRQAHSFLYQILSPCSGHTHMRTKQKESEAVDELLQGAFDANSFSLSVSPTAIFLGSFRMPYEEIRRMILEVDEDQLTEPMIQVTSPLISIHDLSSMPMFREDSHKCEEFRVQFSAAWFVQPCYRVLV